MLSAQCPLRDTKKEEGPYGLLDVARSRNLGNLDLLLLCKELPNCWFKEKSGKTVLRNYRAALKNDDFSFAHGPGPDSDIRFVWCVSTFLIRCIALQWIYRTILSNLSPVMGASQESQHLNEELGSSIVIRDMFFRRMRPLAAFGQILWSYLEMPLLSPLLGLFSLYDTFGTDNPKADPPLRLFRATKS